ncbi:HAMP domain-containing histidine kinase [Nodosilinea sp. LEGE 07088]|uniref:sensor histidine kinase n=1 Tax=Nodosilinea sp. LEGE 07088 TaxID=2777968 RepID=UPI00187F885C|nr:HAMP domain-containing sensor histidine kinase [Nodosilinea sp. LEGE 07088]MBE9139517.1 HAMP domain-containing histidine kinase [Nodosilinea sp. LEGE 07088]
MASENSPVLFQVRPTEGLSSTASTGTEGREIWPLVHALAATLNEVNPLPDLTEVLGTHLGAKACLLLCHYPSTQEVVFTCWHQGTNVTSHVLNMAAADSPTDYQRQVVLGLIQQTTDQSDGKARLRWQKGLTELLHQGDRNPPTWLRTLAHCAAIAVDGSGLQGAILLLDAGGLVIDQTVQANLASLAAIAFHQAHLQSQGQRHTEQMRYLNYLKEDFLSTLNHELRTPLTSMMLAIRMLRRPDLTPERSAMYLDILEQQCTREINLVNDLLMLQTLESKVMPAVVQASEQGPPLANLVAQEQQKFLAADLRLELHLPSEPVWLAVNSDSLNKVLHELLANARKYSAPGTTVTLALSIEQASAQRVAIQVASQGAAIEADELPHIFDKFRRGRNATKDGIAGTGAGLALVRGLVGQMGGTITVSSQPSDRSLWQTCFTLEFPHPAKST